MALPALPPQMMPMGAPPMGGMGMEVGMGMPPAGPPSSVIEADYQLLVQAEQANLAPQPPPWYVPRPAPDIPDLCAAARDQQEKHALRVVRAAWMQLRLGMEISAIFLADKQWVDLKEIEPQASPIGRIMHDTIINFVAAQTVQFRSLATGLVHREERASIEAYLTAMLRAWTHSHYREGRGSLIRTLTADALTGMVAVYHAPVPVTDDNPSGQRLYRMDPKVVFPVFGRDGLDAVYVVYDASAGEVLRDYGDGPGGPATRAIETIARKGKGRGNTQIDYDTTHELIGYWDRQRAIITWKGKVIKRHEHNLWVVPWHVGVPNWRQAADTSTSRGYDLGGNRTGPLVTSNGISLPYEESPVAWGRGTAQQEIARLYEPFLAPWVPVWDKIEKAQTRLTYGVDRSLDPPLAHKRTGARGTDGPPELQNYRGGVTELEEDEELDALPLTPAGDSFAPWMQLFTMEVQAAIPVPILQGQTIGAQASGNAIDVINEMGYSHFSPIPDFMQLFFADLGHRALVYHRDWSPAYEDAMIPTGYDDPATLTSDMLKRAGCYVDCTLRRFTMAGSVATISAAAMLKQQLGLMDDRWYIERLGLDEDPESAIRARRDQDMETAPGFIEAVQIERLYDEMLRAAELGDRESLLRLQTRARRVAAKQTAHDMQIAQMIGAMPPQPEPMPGELPGNAGQPGGNPMPYLSAPDTARATGTMGGAPNLAPPLPGQQG